MENYYGAIKLINGGIYYYFLPVVTVIVKNNRITVQSKSQIALLERLTTAEQAAYDIPFDSLDNEGTSNAVELVEKWIKDGKLGGLSNKTLTYYTGVEAGNPTGAKNLKQVDYANYSMLLTYDNDDDIITVSYV